MSTVNILLARLPKFRQTGPGRYIAPCPAHADRSPSLSIRELEDGRVLIHCFAGCESACVLAAVGLRFSDLCPQRLGHHLASSVPQFFAKDLLLLLETETTVAVIVAGDMVGTRTISATDFDRLILAAGRISRARRMINVAA